MSFTAKDSPEVMAFMVLFARLKQWCDDAPDELAEFAKQDSSVRDLAFELSYVASFLKMNERRYRALFAAPVDPAFVMAWRDYETRYQPVVSGLWFLGLAPEDDGGEISSLPQADEQWKLADEEAREQATGIDAAIGWARDEVSGDMLENGGFLRQLEEGVAAWDSLVSNHGLDLTGVFRRRALAPFVLVPRKISAKSGGDEAVSLLKNLQEAHDAFVFGVPYAAVALMRSIMEAVLRDVYKAEGKDLNERIHSARGRLPRGANAEALHRLRKLANAILHVDVEGYPALRKMDDIQIEKELVSLLYVLRALIEVAR